MSPRRLRRRALPEAWAEQTWPDTMPMALRRVYAARGIVHAGQIEHRLAGLEPPDSLGGLDAACTRLMAALDADQRVLVVGDYDCDGATATAVAVRGLRLLGLRRVDYRVPNRQREGYGLGVALVESLQPVPDLIVTVDNGIASLDGVATARARGIEVIITDHHLPGAALPEAVAIVNPNLPGDAFPSKMLAGVGVMFYLLLALRARLREAGRFDAATQPDLTPLLEWVALGTVADLVKLDANNRILVEAGLRRIRAGKASPGLAALIRVSGREAARLTSTDMAFALAPRINAAGRLEDMRQGIECLLGETPERATVLAAGLDAINRERRQLQQDMVAEAERLAASVDTAGAAMGVCLHEPHWHPGVVGLVASRLKDRLHRPVVALAPASPEQPGQLRGSARSIPGLHLRDTLADVHARHPGLIERFGGHAMAAGLSLPATHLADFARAFDQAVRERLGTASPEPVLWSDGGLAPGELTLELASTLQWAGPWGQGFEVPLFDNDFDCLEVRRMGDCHRRLRLRDPRNGVVLDAVMFQVPEEQVFPEHLHAAYELTVNDWQGRRQVRLLVRLIAGCP